MNSPRHALSALLLCGLLLLVMNVPTRAGGASWNLDPVNSSWNNATNWTPATVPGISDTATFGESHLTNISASGQSAAEIVFPAGASAYTITRSHFTMSDVGVTNISGVMQNFVVPATSAQSGYIPLSFTNASTAGSDMQYTVAGSPQSSFDGGRVEFINNANAGSANFIMQGGTKGAAIVYFRDAFPAGAGAGSQLAFGEIH